MISVSNGFRAVQKSSSIRPVRKIELARRLPDGSGWEPAAVDITSEVVRLDRLSWKLDTDALNEFKASNIRIEMENSERQWDEGSPSRFSGYLRYRSRIQIFLGLEIVGTEEIFPVFTGVIEDVIEDSESPTVQLSVESLDSLLRTQAAETGGIIVNDELLGIGDGVQAEFFPSQFPLGVVKEIRVGGQPLRPGLQFTVSDLNDPNKPGKITFVSAQPGPGEEVRADYIAWKTDQAIDQVVTDLLALVPQVPLGLIETVIFDPPVDRQILHTLKDDFGNYELRRAVVQDEDPPPQNDGLITIDGFDSKEKWQDGTVSGINFNRVPDGISPQWTSQYEAEYLPEEEKQEIDGDPNYPWQEDYNQAVGTTRNLANGILSVNQPDSFYHLSNLKEGPSLSRSIMARIRVTQIGGTIEIGGMVGQSPYLGAQIRIRHTNKLDVQTGAGSSPFVNVDLTQFHDYRLALNLVNSSSGTWELFIDGVSVRSGNLQTAPAGAQAGIYFRSTVTAQTYFDIDYLRFNGDNAQFPIGTWEKEIDYGVHLAGLTSFSLINTLGPFASDHQGNPANARYFFSWKPDGGSYSPEIEVAAGANLGSFSNIDFPRFIKFRAEVTGDENPVLYGLTKLFLPALAVSNVIDGGSGVVSFDTWKGTFVPGDGSVQRFTAAVANSASGFSYYQALGPGDSIETDEFAAGQGVAVEQLIFIALLSTPGLNLPILRESLFNFTTRSVLISQANVSGKSVLDVVNELARIADFEIGLKGDGSFFFRNKVTGSLPVAVLDDSNTERVNSFSPGWERVFNRIQSSFGDFIKEIDPASEGDPSPTSTDKFGDRFLSVGGGSLIYQTDVDLATVMAKRYYSRYKEPRRRITLVVRFMPELELGHRVTVRINIPRQIAQPFDARILGIAHDLMNFRTELDLQEI
jgi:hypothetical protein